MLLIPREYRCGPSGELVPKRPTVAWRPANLNLLITPRGHLRSHEFALMENYILAPSNIDAIHRAGRNCADRCGTFRRAEMKPNPHPRRTHPGRLENAPHASPDAI